MTTLKDTSKSTSPLERPELVDNWVLVTILETIILTLLLPALFRLGLFWGVVDLLFILFLGGGIYVWRRGNPVGYYSLVTLYVLSGLAWLAAGLTFLTIAPALVSLVVLIGAYLASYLDWRERSGYSFVVKALVVII